MKRFKKYEASFRKHRKAHRPISRRQFLSDLAAAAAGLVVAGCQPSLLSPTVPLATEPVKTPPTETSAPTATPTPLPLTATPLPSPTATATPVPPTATPTMPPSLATVALSPARDYDLATVRRQVVAMLDGLGGLADVVRPGDRVALKVNLTGGTAFAGAAGLPATETFVTHPAVVQVVVEALRDAGAGEVFIVEAVYEWDSYRIWGYEDVARAVDATLIDLNSPHPYTDFATISVGTGKFIYEDFIFNHILEDIDVFVSVAKMKCHGECGITLSMKNLIGLVPAQHYLGASDSYRAALHGTGDEFKTRLPRVIMDLNRARPIHLAVIDAIKTSEGGEGPWHSTFGPVAPGVLLAGKNPLATDAVGAAVMGFDPTAPSFSAPFVKCENYFNLGREIGLGTNQLDEVAVVGASVDDVRTPFKLA